MAEMFVMVDNLPYHLVGHETRSEAERTLSKRAFRYQINPRKKFILLEVLAVYHKKDDKEFAHYIVTALGREDEKRYVLMLTCPSHELVWVEFVGMESFVKNIKWEEVDGHQDP